MTRGAWLVAGALLLTASPRSTQPLTLVAPLGPSTPQSSIFLPAPVPDQDMSAPLGAGSQAGAGPSVTPGLSRPGSGPTYQSGGFTPGSTYNNAQDNRFRPLPMLNLSVPLQ